MKGRLFSAHVLLADLGVFLLLAATGLAIGLTLNLFRAHPLPLRYQSETDSPNEAISDQPRSTGSYWPSSSISLARMEEFVAKKEGLFFDARSEDSYRSGHIPGALSFPIQAFDKAYSSHQASLEHDRSQPIVVYCSKASCRDSRQLQSALRSRGYANVAVFVGGWAEWKRHHPPPPNP